MSSFRKSTSLSPATHKDLSRILTDAVYSLAEVLEAAEDTVSQPFRDAWACHLYMLYTYTFLWESHVKGQKNIDLQIRQASAECLDKAAMLMLQCKSTLWNRGVPDEAVVVLPSRMAYTWLEMATGVLARKAACADHALSILRATTDAQGSSLNQISAALMDMMHNYEHMAQLTAELCTQHEKLAAELLREMGRLSAPDSKQAAPFVAHMAEEQPRWVLQQLPHLLTHLQSEAYPWRSALVTALGHIVAALFDAPDADNAEAIQKDKDTQNRLLDLLMERMYDVSSYTRATVLKVWIKLTQDQHLPKDRTLPLTQMALDRLQDKTVLVRKQAMQLLTVLLENNPFMGNLNPDPYRNKLGELYEYVKNHLPTDIAAAHQVNMEQDGDESVDEESRLEMEQAALAAAMAEVDAWLETPEELSSSQTDFCTKVQALRFTQSALDFIEVFADAPLEGMLLSANTSDVTEALRFFVKAHHFGLPCALRGIKRSLALMWSSEAAIRDEVLKAFVEVFIAGSNGRLPDVEIARNLLILVQEATVSELASIEEAITRLVQDERLPVDVFLTLWNVAQQENNAAALQLLSMGASADRRIIDSKSRLKSLLQILEESPGQWRLASTAAMLLQRMNRAKVDPSDAKFLVLERLMEELCVVAQGDACVDDNVDSTLAWFSAAEQALKALFVICPEPETACRSILVAMCHVTFDSDEQQCHSLRLARFFHVLGQTALNLLVYTEALSASVRRANAKRTLHQQEAGGDDMEDELGMAQEAEAENERKMADISENEILSRGLIRVFGPLLVRVVAQGGDSVVLKQASVLCLCKFMCVSSQFCEKHLSLLFTAFANSNDTTLHANTVVALGDLAFRFPNQVEPYTPRLYACLRDKSTKVRRHTLMVLTHLILNDMVKVKGQVCEIALCLRDPDSRIRDMSRLLFHELAKRSHNPVYNLLPDILSQLSQLSLSKEDFRSILGFLLGYIKKERQNEMLTEKLCLRFPKAITLAQKADLAYCLAQLKLNEKSLKILSDHFKLYQDALVDEDVVKSFSSIVTKAKKLTLKTSGQILEEWQSKLQEASKLGKTQMEESDDEGEDDEDDESLTEEQVAPAAAKGDAATAEMVNDENAEINTSIAA